MFKGIKENVMNTLCKTGRKELCVFWIKSWRGNMGAGGVGGLRNKKCVLKYFAHLWKRIYC